MRKELDNNYFAEVASNGKSLGKNKVEVQTNLDDVIIKSAQETVDGGLDVFCPFDYLIAGMPVFEDWRTNEQTGEVRKIYYVKSFPNSVNPARVKDFSIVGVVGKTVKNTRNAQDEYNPSDYQLAQLAEYKPMYSTSVPVVTKGTVNMLAYEQALRNAGFDDFADMAIARFYTYAKNSVITINGIRFEAKNMRTLYQAICYEGSADLSCDYIKFPKNTPVGGWTLLFGLPNDGKKLVLGIEDDCVGVSTHEIGFALTYLEAISVSERWYYSSLAVDKINTIKNVTISKSAWLNEFKEINKDNEISWLANYIEDVDFSIVESQLAALGITIVP